uniref:Uncharacterized protein n=1 Tax=Bombyx mori TaxID=7091 RepID=A0A8R2R2D2_BOMMO|nr:uncharacterized protein LOC119629298 [Bombyx mori]
MLACHRLHGAAGCARSPASDVHTARVARVPLHARAHLLLTCILHVLLACRRLHGAVRLAVTQRAMSLSLRPATADYPTDYLSGRSSGTPATRGAASHRGSRLELGRLPCFHIILTSGPRRHAAFSSKLICEGRGGHFGALLPIFEVEVGTTVLYFPFLRLRWARRCFTSRLFFEQYG